MSTQESSGSLTKWQLAIIVGAPVAAVCVLGAFYYWKSSKYSAETQQDDAEKVEHNDKSIASQADVPGNEAPESEDLLEENMVRQ